MPAFNCPSTLQACLEGLVASDLPRAQWELIVVDDGSSDRTPQVARAVADFVLFTTNGPRGPSEARNVGASVANGPILLFVDADVVVAPTTLSGFLRVLAENPQVVSVFGSYDAAPAHPSFLSQYRNLLHRYVHVLHPGEASTFWAGCGAVRRAEFLQVGGYDSARYPRPQIEDIELGYRLRDHGFQILLVPELEAKHLKHWTFRSMVRTDFRDRAIPWMHILLDRREAVSTGPLNLAVREKILTGLCGIAALLACVSVVTVDWRWASSSFVLCLFVVAGNASLLRWFVRERGVWFTLRVVPMRLLFYLLSGAGAGWAIVTHRFRPSTSSLSPLHDRRERVLAA